MRRPLIAILCSLPLAACLAPIADEVTSEASNEATIEVASAVSSLGAPLAIALAPSPITTQLMTTHHLTAIVTTAGATAGNATVSLAAVDSVTGAPAAGWTITPPQLVAVPATGAALVGFDVTIPGDSASLSVDLKAEAVLGALVADAPGHVDVAKHITITYAAGVGPISPHAGLGPQSVTVRAGTVLDFVNADSIVHVTHGAGGIPHESSAGGRPGATYSVTVNSSGVWYCHSHETTSLARTVTVVP